MNQLEFYLTTFAVSFALVFVRAFQQRNVMERRYLLALPTSFLFAAFEVTLIVRMAENGFGWIVVPLALGGWTGSVSAIWTHHRLTQYLDNRKHTSA